MVKFRVSVLFCLAIALMAGWAYAPPFETPKYADLPEEYATYKIMREEAAWYIKAFNDPVNVFKQEPDNAIKFMGFNSYDVSRFSQQGAEAIRLVLSRSLVAKAKYDPYFEAIMQIANIQSDDKVFAVQAVQMLVDALRAYAPTYPGVKEPAKQILLAKIEDPRSCIKYVAITGLGLLNNSPAPPDVIQALIRQLSVNDDVVIDASAAALGNLGDKSAVRPLMEKFLAMPDDVAPAEASEDSAEAAQGGSLPSGQPVNQARLTVVIAVDNIAGLKLGFSGLVYKDEIMGRYEQLKTWWEENKDKYP